MEKNNSSFVKITLKPIHAGWKNTEFSIVGTYSYKWALNT
jgi:hypothetical protein